MASSIATRAERRAGEHEAAIRACLRDGASKQALVEAVRALTSECAKLRARRPADGALADAELAGSLLAIAAQLHHHRPPRPAGCLRVPSPADLEAAFGASLALASNEGERHG